MKAVPGVGFIGTGKMATALAVSWVRAGLIDASRSLGSDPAAASREAFCEETGIGVTASNPEVWERTDVVVLAVKPHVVEAVLRSADPGGQHLVISIAAGIGLKRLEKWASESARLVRVMPNTPAMVGKGASGFSRGSRATDADMAMVQGMLAAVGEAFEVPESLLDAVTGLSGSGPAYAYLMIEAMSDGGVAAGLPREAATRLAAQTLLGAAAMVLETGHHPGALKDMVSSPGGTTIAGIHQLERAGFRAAVMDAVTTAAARSRELGQASG